MATWIPARLIREKQERLRRLHRLWSRAQPLIGVAAVLMVVWPLPVLLGLLCALLVLDVAVGMRLASRAELVRQTDGLEPPGWPRVCLVAGILALLAVGALLTIW